MAEPKKLLDRANNLIANIGKICWFWYTISFGVTLFSMD